MIKNNIFSAGEILLPSFEKKSEGFTKFAVIACDQFTSDISYWDRVESMVGSNPSSYNYILPEAYLNTEREKVKKVRFQSMMENFDESVFSHKINGFIYLERTLSNGCVRCGILGKLDLEQYDFNKDSKSSIRATEETVISRIPPRRELRAMAKIELPHAMVFSDDKTGLFAYAKELVNNCSPVYDFDLMENGGHLCGYEISGEKAELLEDKIAKNEAACLIPYAMGDGNHSIAAAKSHYEEVKKSLGASAVEHPARYALCEIVSIYDDAIVFEPIHRIVKNVSPVDILEKLGEITADGEGVQSVRVITSDGDSLKNFTKLTHSMTVGTLQNFIDDYIRCHPEAECDYIHGEQELRELANNSNSVAFMFEGFDKSKLFDYIENGPMPRKTFSMGDARSKRYYLEARFIV